MTSEYVPDIGGFILIPEQLYDNYHTIFRIFNALSRKKAEQFREQNRKDVKHFMLVKGSEIESLINKLVLPSLLDSKLLSEQLNVMRTMMHKKILSMHDIFNFLEAQYILKYTQKGADIFEKVANENNN